MNISSFRHGIDGSDGIGICENNSKRPVDALAVKTSITHLLTTWNQEMLAHLKSCFQSKTQKLQNTKQTLVPEGRISQNIPQLDQFAVCTVSMFREETPTAIFGQKKEKAPCRCRFFLLNVDNFIVSPVRSRCIESDVAFIFGSQLGRSLMEASGSAGHESDQDTSAQPWCIWTCFWIGLKENSE